MAPALTETNQEDNFKLPHSPNTTTIINTGIAQSNGDRYTCNIPFEILPTNCNIFIGNISKTDVDLDCYTDDKLSSSNSHINGNTLLDKNTINSDSIHNLATVFDNGNADSLTSGLMGKNSQEKNMKAISNDMCELSKLVAQKLVHSDVAVQCIDHLYQNGTKRVRTDSTNNLSVKINGELIMDNSDIPKCDYIPDNLSNVLNEQRLWAETSKRVEKLQQNSVKLMKRIRYLQMRKATIHVRSEIGNFVSYGQSRLDAHQDNHKRLKLSQKPTLTNRIATNVSSIMLTNAEKKKLHYLRERQASTQVPMNIETKANSKIDNVIVRIDSKDCAEIKRTVGTLRFNLNHLGLSIDSDVTDSSSGGESCEEAEEICEKKKNPQVPIHRRAAWKWSVDRAEIAYRWIWLQAQILDLEQRIRRLNSLCQKFRSVKKTPFQSMVYTDGNIKCECQKQIPACTAYDDNDSSVKSVNGYITDRTDDTYSKYSHSEGCNLGTSRTRPFESFRKRKLYRLKDIRMTGIKAARLSAVKCSCKSQENLISCILCTGQYNRTFALDPDMMALSEKTALLEPSYHSVLSLQQDIPLSFHFEMLLKRCKISRQATKGDSLSNKKPHLVPQIRRRYKQAKKVAEILLPSAASLKRQKDQSQSLPSSPNNSRPSSPSSYTFFNPDGISSITGRRRRESAYDINNIVIPCCIVPTIRIEKLQYKEILTPKWRIACEEKTKKYDEMENEIVEDLSDETFLARHQKCEVKEKKWFMSYIRVRTYGRGRSRSLRFDVVPSSPHSFPNSEDLFSGCDDMLSNPHSPDVFSTISSSDMSLEEETKDSILDDEYNDRIEQNAAEPMEIIDKKPYDRRTFPLTDEQYEEMLMEVNMPEKTDKIFSTANSPIISTILSSEET